MVAKAVKTDWQPSNGIVIFIGESGEAKDGIAVPIAALPTLAAQARRFMSGAQAAQMGTRRHGEFLAAQLAQAQTYDVGLVQTSTGEKVSLILDRESETEIGFAIDSEHASELGRQLSENAALASKTRPAKN